MTVEHSCLHVTLLDLIVCVLLVLICVALSDTRLSAGIVVTGALLLAFLLLAHDVLERAPERLDGRELIAYGDDRLEVPVELVYVGKDELETLAWRKTSQRVLGRLWVYFCFSSPVENEGLKKVRALGRVSKGLLQGRTSAISLRSSPRWRSNSPLREVVAPALDAIGS